MKMVHFGPKWNTLTPFSRISLSFFLAFLFTYVQAQQESPSQDVSQATKLFWESNPSGYQHVWPEMSFGWKIVVATLIGFFGAAFGSVRGVGGGGVFVPMLNVIVGFDPKSASAMSKCMITGASISTVYYNLKLRHPLLDMPIIDYNIVLLILPVLLLGISIGVTLSVLFADWMITVLLIILCTFTSVKALLKGIETWRRETVLKEERGKLSEISATTSVEVQYKPLSGGLNNNNDKGIKDSEVSIVDNIYWREFGLLVFVWAAFLALQIAKNYTTTCSTAYWVLNLAQVPFAAGVHLYAAIGLYKGHRVIECRGVEGTNWKVHQLVLCCISGIVAGIIGGLLGIGGGFVMGPIFLELGIHPLVASATATLGMVFSASMSVVQYYLLNRFPVPYALYFIGVATVAAFVGQHIVTKVVTFTGRASLIIFILAFTIFISAISLGWVGIASMIEKIEDHEYMGFENLCKV